MCALAGRCELDAARAYNRAAKALHGSAAKLNLLPDKETVGVETKNVALTSGMTHIEDGGMKGAVSDAQEGGKGETDEHRAAPAVNASSGANEGVTIKSTPTVVSLKLEDVGKEANATPTWNTSSSSGGVGTLGVDGNVEAYGVGAQFEPIAGLMNATMADFSVGIGGTQNESMNSPPTDVRVIGNDFPFLPELDFRDLEEIPMSAGPSLADDSNWKAASSEADIRLSSEISRSGDSFSRISGDGKVSLPLEQELTPDLEKFTRAGDVSAGEIDVSEVPSSMPLQVDRLTSSSGLHDTKRLSAAAAAPTPDAAATPDAFSEGPVLSSSHSGLKPCFAEEAGGSSQTFLALPDAKLQTVSSGFDGPSPLQTLEETNLSDVGAVAVLPPGATASVDHEVISGEGGVIELGADEGTGDSYGRDGDAWRLRAPEGTGSSAWEKAGEDLYEENLKGVVDVRCVSPNAGVDTPLCVAIIGREC